MFVYHDRECRLNWLLLGDVPSNLWKKKVPTTHWFASAGKPESQATCIYFVLQRTKKIFTYLNGCVEKHKKEHVKETIHWLQS